MNSTGSLGIAVRCNTAPQSSCIDLNPTKGPQLQPPANYQLSYPNSAAIGGDDLSALEDMARANGTWYATCPANPNGDVVYVKNAGSSCLYNNSAPAATGAAKCCNTQANPGLYVVERGKVNFGGNIEFWGVVYNANLDNSSAENMVETSGTSAGTAGVVQNTWREIVPADAN